MGKAKAEQEVGTCGGCMKSVREGEYTVSEGPKEVGGMRQVLIICGECKKAAEGYLSSHWFADRVDITLQCLRADWHRATAIDNCAACGMSREDATTFVEFAFADEAGEDTADLVTDDQWNRLHMMTGTTLRKLRAGVSGRKLQ